MLEMLPNTLAIESWSVEFNYKIAHRSYFVFIFQKSIFHAPVLSVHERILVIWRKYSTA